MKRISTSRKYDHKDIESKWQNRWSEDGIYHVSDDDPRPKWYELTMYPYPSGDLHIGHWYAMAPSDAHARFKRMQGFNVLHPMGFDAFGLPAENAAIKRNIHPRTWTMGNIENMRTQLKSMGAIYDWKREVVTCLPDYYKWNQWFFLQLYKNGLAYRAYAPANWCPSCNTVLANEQVLDDGQCERCNTPVTHRDLNQWFFRITQYAEELLDHSNLKWPEKINVMQTNWIGRSEGVEIEFDISEYGLDEKVLATFTTRIDTIFGVSFIVLAPEHPLVSRLTTSKHSATVAAYIEHAKRQTEVERLSTEKEKTGAFTGAYCINRLNGNKVPILVADYVLGTYGTGVVMGVPAHDQRDFEFASKFELPVTVVIEPPGWNGDELEQAFIGEGIQINSDSFNGLSSKNSKENIADYVESKGWGSRSVNYRMRDWLISRQRYWGTPIPIVYCNNCGVVPVPEQDLPVLLPEDAEFRPTGESPLALHKEFLYADCPECGKSGATRETDTMDTFVDSSWYFLRFASPHTKSHAFDSSANLLWSPVDQYTGGAEHAVMHLLYARFFTKALRDLNLLEFDEPFINLFNQGHIVADKQKMSKSRGNVIAPDEYVSSVGADAVRCYLMFLGPWDQGGEWSDTGLNGTSRWLNRVYELANRDTADLSNAVLGSEGTHELQRLMHKTIGKVSDDITRFKFNTALATLMEYSNHLNRIWELKSVDTSLWVESIKTLLLLLAPMAPHVTEELWTRIGQEYSIHQQLWPEWDPQLAAEEIVTMVIQVNGRLRDRIDVPASITEKEATALAIGSQKVQRHTKGLQIKKVIYVPSKLVNIVAQ